MKMIVVVALALVAIASAAPQAAYPVEIAKKIIEITEFKNEQEPDGKYYYGFKSEDGTSKSEQGELHDAIDEDNKPRKVVVVRGSYTYTDSEGKPQTVNYYADESGFHAEGDIIPKAEAYAPVRR